MSARRSNCQSRSHSQEILKDESVPDSEKAQLADLLKALNDAEANKPANTAATDVHTDEVAGSSRTEL